MIWYVVTMAVLAVVTVFCLIRSIRSKREIAPYVTNLLIWLFIPIISNTILALSTGADVLRFCYTVYFISTTVLLYYFAQFSLEYCSFRIRHPAIGYFMAGIMGLDVVSVALNYLWGHVFTLEYVTTAEESGYVFQSLWYHKIHLLISAALWMFAVVAFSLKTIKTSKLYRDRYITAGDSGVYCLFPDNASRSSAVVFPMPPPARSIQFSEASRKYVSAGYTSPSLMTMAGKRLAES